MEIFGRFKIEIDVDIHLGCFSGSSDGVAILEMERLVIEKLIKDLRPTIKNTLMETGNPNSLAEYIFDIEDSSVKVNLVEVEDEGERDEQ